jgi:hypothetical protein
LIAGNFWTAPTQQCSLPDNAHTHPLILPYICLFWSADICLSTYHLFCQTQHGGAVDLVDNTEGTDISGCSFVNNTASRGTTLDETGVRDNHYPLLELVIVMTSFTHSTTRYWMIPVPITPSHHPACFVCPQFLLSFSVLFFSFFLFFLKFCSSFLFRG